MSSFDELMAGVSDEMLIAKAREWADKLEADGRSYRMCMPAQWDDPDIVFSELANRYNERKQKGYELAHIVGIARNIESSIRNNEYGVLDDKHMMGIWMNHIRLMCNQFFV